MVVLTYVPAEKSNEKILGNIISIEFVPNNFVLSIEK